jgi:nicotinate phosphoribosyltransferase
MPARKLPARRGFLLAAGLEQALDYLEGMRFDPDELEWLARTGRFKPRFIERLATLRFTGDVDAMPEGTACFPDEPVLRVRAPSPEAQLVETRLVNLVHCSTPTTPKRRRALSCGWRPISPAAA